MGILRRRKVQFVVPVIIISAIAAALAFGLPAVYRSAATILVEAQEIPHELVQSTVTSYAAERIQVISQRIMTRTNLSEIVERFDLFPQERAEGKNDDIIQKMRENINVRMVSADVVDPRSGRSGQATIAFELSFDSVKPESARDVASELASLYLSENQKLRTEKAETTSVFLAEEADRLRKQIADYEEKLASFKEKNVGRLPELMQMNLDLMNRTDREREDTERQVAMLQERKAYLESQLAQIEPNTGTSPAAKLRDLRTEYLTAAAQYSKDHPRIGRLRREIEALEKQTGFVDESRLIADQVLAVRAELSSAREKYSADHPTVARLEKQLASLESSLKASASANGVLTAIPPDNPAYISIQTQLEAANLSIRSEIEKRARVKEKLAEYESRLVQIPRVEQEYLLLKRDYESAVGKFSDIKQKLLQAEIAEQLEKESKGERFSLIDPPQLPDKPIKPNRLGIFLLGMLLSLGGGLGMATFAEYTDKTIHGVRSIVSVLTSPPLAIIPRFISPSSVGGSRRIPWVIVGLSVLTVLLIAALLYSMMVTPGDTLVGPE
ncbi:MAG: hypothetical protein FD165_2177 [Gammaproteobacteria bacterium]|nr:MAG: hypothetical protein FD165_2177 [Gammaproteobacteria bacterium]TND05336.1 MAG: hypothetical protein FD120_1211 [Gammaproteobacteria bacterium]